MKEYVIYYGPVCMDQGMMAKRGSRKKLIEHCGDREY